MAKLETLPWLVLDRICEYLHDDDDTHAIYQGGSSNLRAFSLTSRGCCTATTSWRFCQLRMAVTNGNDVIRVLERWAEILDRHGGRYHHVRRLKVISPGQDEVDDEWSEHHYAPWLSDLPRFCSPPASPTEDGQWRLQSTTDEPWAALARFIGQLPALRDVIWGFCNMPRPVLAAIHAAMHATGTCRLHMHRFRLDSVVLHRNGPPLVIDIDPDDYTLATSPALYSVVAGVRGFETDGELNYNGEAVLGMVAGAAPNLRQLWMLPSRPGSSIALMQSISLGRPPAPDHSLFSPKGGQGKGSLRSLFCAAGSLGGIQARADFSRLSCLTCSPWSSSSADMLAGVAARGELAALRSLYLGSIWSDATRATGELFTALRQNSLQALSVGGHIDAGLFDAILNQHGRSLCYLSLYPDDDYETDEYPDSDRPAPAVLPTPALYTQLAGQCPNLQVLELHMDRTRSDTRECAIYHTLSRLKRLKRLSLTLRFAVLPNEDEPPDEEDKDPIDYGEDIPRAYLSQAFANAAVDADLARAIFDRVAAAPRSKLEHLRLLVRRKEGRYAPASLDWRFGCLLNWFARDWICERRGGGGGGGDGQGRGVKVREYGAGATANGGREWQEIGEAERLYNGEEVFVQAFGDVWPQTTERWWEDWRSLPLCLGDADTQE